jgi:hypothetical protein
MQRGGEFVRPIVGHSSVNLLIPALTFAIALAMPAAAQVYMHPPTTTTVGGHFLAPPPSVTSVTSLSGRHTPPPAPSVTSIPNFGQRYHNGSFNNGRYNRGGYAGWAYSIPYYYPVDNSAYGYDYVGAGGPDLYSGPPPGAYDPTLHIVAEQPPANPYVVRMPDPPASEARPAKPLPDDKPGDPTVLVFRDGKRQEVNSYAIMGDALYVFDQGRKTVALADLDIPATTKANDERGVEFRLPPANKKKAAITITVPSSATPDVPPNNTASAGTGATSMP